MYSLLFLIITLLYLFSQLVIISYYVLLNLLLLLNVRSNIYIRRMSISLSNFGNFCLQSYAIQNQIISVFTVVVSLIVRVVCLSDCGGLFNGLCYLFSCFLFDSQGINCDSKMDWQFDDFRCFKWDLFYQKNIFSRKSTLD